MLQIIFKYFRRVIRDIEERGRDLEHVLHQYTTLVKPAFDEFCIPTKKYADVIVPRGAENTMALELIKQYIQVQLLTVFTALLRDLFQDIICKSKQGSPLCRSSIDTESKAR